MKIYLTLLAAFAFSGAATSQTVGSEQRTHRASQGDSTGIVSTTLPGNGSVDFIDADHLKKGLVTNSVNELAGQAAGVVVSSAADRMAMLSSVRVRGTTSLTGGNDPLVIIDGVYSDLTTLIGIYPADIESFTILKNAAETAPFGSRGASGVIVVSTKKGKNQKFQIAYDTNMGFERVFKTLNMLKAADYLATADRLGLTSMTRGTEDTDFQRGITRTGLVQNHHIAFSGGNEKSNYRASLGFMDHNTVVRVNKYQTFTAKVDLQQKAFSDLLAIDLGMFASTQRNEYIYDQQKLFYSAAAQNPSLPFGSKKTGWQRNANASQINPPGALLEDKKHERQQTVNTHLGLDFDLSRYIAIEGRDASLQPSFHVKAFGSYSNSSIANNEFQPTWTSGDGKIMRKEEKYEDWLGNLMVNFSNQWGIHKLSATALAEYHRGMRRGYWTTVKGLTNNSMGYDGVAGGAIIPYGDTGSDYESPSLLSFLGMAEYTLLNAYTLSATVRADGSSLFGANNRWGVFPSVSASWDVLKTFSIPQPTMLKLRTGYGLSGNLGGIESYNTMMLIRPSGVVPWEDKPQVTFAQLSNINPDLKWETRSSFNIGLDVGTWNNRLVLTAEYYYSRTRDMLYQYEVPVPPFPYNKWVANLGKMSNQGFEIGLGITPILKRDLELNINVNMSFQKNRLISLSGYYKGTYMRASDITPLGSLDGAGFHGGNNNIVYQIVGQPLGVFYLPHCTGITTDEKGRKVYEIADLDGNGTVNLEDGGDRYIAGQAMPKMLLGSNISLRYKDFDFSVQMNGAFGHKIYNGTALTYMNMGSFPDYNVFAKAPEQGIYDQRATDYYLENGNYLNFDYVTVGWNVPIKKGKVVSALRLSLSVNNLATITAYSGLSPMINYSAVGPTLGIDDKRTYPPYRSYCLGVSIQF